MRTMPSPSWHAITMMLISAALTGLNDQQRPSRRQWQAQACHAWPAGPTPSQAASASPGLAAPQHPTITPPPSAAAARLAGRGIYRSLSGCMPGMAG